MEVYPSETREVIKRFLAGPLSFPDCISSLNATLAGLVPKLTSEQVEPLRALTVANNETVMKGMERRGHPFE